MDDRKPKLRAVNRQLIGGPWDGRYIKTDQFIIKLPQPAVFARLTDSPGELPDEMLACGRMHLPPLMYEAFDVYDAGDENDPDRVPCLKFYARYIPNKKA